MSTRRTLLTVLACLALAATVTVQAAPNESEPESSSPGHLEKPGDPPGAATRDEQLRSPGGRVTVGGFQSVQVNVDSAGSNIVGDAANEPSIAIDPTNPDVIVIGWRQFDTVSSNFRQAGYAYSHDGGQTWTFPGVLQPGQFRSDPVLAADSAGNIFYYSLSSVTTAEMFISADGGLNWNGPVPAFGGDKTWMDADTSGGIGDGNLYPIWNSQFTCCAPGTDYTRSTDGGLNYEGPFALPQKPKWGTVAVGPDGEVYVVGSRLSVSNGHVIQKSTNAQDPAQTPAWGVITDIDLGGITNTGGLPNPGGLNGQVWVAVDRSAGATRGNVYVLGSVDPVGSDPQDVHFIRSTDGGATWTAPLRINDDPPGTDAWQWFGTMSVAPNGRIDVVWNDTRNDATGRTSETYYAYSLDAGSTWSANVPVSPPWDSLVGHPNQDKIGDYYHMISDNAAGNLAYAATFNNEQDVYFLRVGDCNANGVHDSDDIAGGATDCDGDGILDECDSDISCPPCDDDGTCEDGETCFNCTNDCIIGAAGCGNGTCEPILGEDCVSCPLDCNGKQKGAFKNQFCCGDGDGVKPVGCGDPRCSSSGFACSNLPPEATCCGDDICEGSENTLNCPQDCTSTGNCGNSICDAGEDCETCPSDCEGKTTGKPTNRFCCGNGVLEPPEGDGSRCNGNP